MRNGDWRNARVSQCGTALGRGTPIRKRCKEQGGDSTDPAIYAPGLFRTAIVFVWLSSKPAFDTPFLHSQHPLITYSNYEYALPNDSEFRKRHGNLEHTVFNITKSERRDISVSQNQQAFDQIFSKYPKIRIRDCELMGRAVFASQNISKQEIVLIDRPFVSSAFKVCANPFIYFANNWNQCYVGDSLSTLL